MDVKTALFIPRLEEDIYMAQLVGMKDTEGPKKCANNTKP